MNKLITFEAYNGPEPAEKLDDETLYCKFMCFTSEINWVRELPNNMSMVAIKQKGTIVPLLTKTSFSELEKMLREE